jgi:tetratricopeptide (TPR) repeat protein
MKAVVEMAEKVSKNPQASVDQVATAEFYIGKSAFDQKDFDKALNAFNKVVRNSDNEQTAEARYLIAYIYYQKRDLEIANNLCDQAAKESAQYEYWVAKSILLQSDIAAEQGDLVSAKAALEAVIENFNKDPELVKIAQDKLDALDGKSKNKLSPNKPTNNLLEMDNDKN